MQPLKQVRIISNEMIKPARSLDHPPKLKLTEFDNILGMIPYQQRILFYKPLRGAPYDQSEEEILHRLKKSLSEVLVVFYPLAGRIITDEEGSPVIDCGAGESVRFIHAVTDSTLEQLGELFQPSEFCDSLCDMDSGIPSYPWTPEDPPLLIQVTRFSCGGMSLGFAFNHLVMDGTSAWHFMNSWADVERIGVCQAPPDITYSFKFPNLTQEQLEEQKRRLGLHLPISGITDSRTPTAKLVTKVFHLEPAMIQRLKTAAAAASNGAKPSAFVVIGAYFWRRVTLARQFVESSDETRFIVIVNCRERIPSLPKRYFGNAASAFAVTLQAGEIQKNEWFSSCTKVIHDGIRSRSGEGLAEGVAYFLWMLNHPEEIMDLNFWYRVVHPIGSHNHPVFKTEFGFGKPVGVTVGSNDLGDGKLYLFPSAKGDGGLTAILVLPPDVMSRVAEQEDSDLHLPV